MLQPVQLLVRPLSYRLLHWRLQMFVAKHGLAVNAAKRTASSPLLWPFHTAGMKRDEESMKKPLFSRDEEGSCDVLCFPIPIFSSQVPPSPGLWSLLCPVLDRTICNTSLVSNWKGSHNLGQLKLICWYIKRESIWRFQLGTNQQKTRFSWQMRSTALHAASRHGRSPWQGAKRSESWSPLRLTKC